jgi:hypothetical protein
MHKLVTAAAAALALGGAVAGFAGPAAAQQGGGGGQGGDHDGDGVFYGFGLSQPYYGAPDYYGSDDDYDDYYYGGCPQVWRWAPAYGRYVLTPTC